MSLDLLLPRTPFNIRMDRKTTLWPLYKPFWKRSPKQSKKVSETYQIIFALVSRQNIYIDDAEAQKTKNPGVQSNHLTTTYDLDRSSRKQHLHDALGTQRLKAATAWKMKKWEYK
jgi:hypothetical protein